MKRTQGTMRKGCLLARGGIELLLSGSHPPRLIELEMLREIFNIRMVW